MTKQEADEQIEAATDAIRATLRQLLQEGQVHPQVIILALATALGEFAAGAALATSEDVGPMSDDLAALVREVMELWSKLGDGGLREAAYRGG